MSVRTPTYRLHKGSGQALVCLGGNRIYLGPHGSPESRQRFNRLLAEWFSRGAVDPPSERQKAAKPAVALTVAEVAAAYKLHCDGYYKSGHIHHCRAAMLALDELYGETDAAEFSTPQFDALIAALVAKGLARTYINHLSGTIRRCFKWAARQGLIPVATWHQVQLVDGLRKGRTEAREPDDVGPVPEADVQATLPYLPEVVGSMVKLQRLLGCRPGELVQMRPADIDTSGPVWFYTPRTHKTAYRGKARRIAVGPKAQALLRPYLLRAADSHCFRPADSERKRHDEQRERRKSRVQPSQAKRRPKARPRKAPGEFYTVGIYRTAVQRAARKAGVAVWSVNQLRHSAATEIRREYGLEAAQVVLGHSRADVSQVYAERNDALAASIAAKIG